MGGRRKSPEIPVGFPILPEEVFQATLTQGRLHIPGDPNLGEMEPVGVLKFDFASHGEVIVQAGTPVTDRRACIVKNLLWNLRHYTQNEQALAAMSVLRAVEPEDPTWAKLARGYKTTNTKLHRKMLGQLVELVS